MSPNPKPSPAAPREPPPAALTPEERWQEAGAGISNLEEGEYRRRREPVRVRRRSWAGLLRRGWKPALAGAVVLGVGAGMNAWLFHSAWFVLSGSDQIAVSGARQTDPAQVVSVFAPDLGRNVFFIPIATRRTQIEALPWVSRAAVLRLWPARIQVQISERVPVAFSQAGGRLEMLDATGVVLGPARGGNYDFPVLTGLPGMDASNPNAPEWRARRQPAMQLYAALCAALDQGGGNRFTRDFSEIDLSAPDDVTAVVSTAGAAGATVLIHLGNRDFATRYQLFRSQIAGWRQKYPNLAAVDLRYDGEAIVDPGPAAAQP